MQNGFFDDLLKQENERVEEEKKEILVEESKTENNDTEVFDFGKMANEMPKESVESNIEPQTADISQEVEKKVEKPIQEKKSENKGKMIDEQKEIKQVPKQNAAPAVKKDFSQALIENTLNKINDIVTYSNEVFTPQSKIIACDIITYLDHTLNERGYAWNQIDAKGSGLIMQIKKWAKLGIDCSTDKLYADIRRNGNTNLYDIKIKGQYQTIEKLMVQYCRQNIIKFKTEVVCVGDKLQTHFDYITGEEKVVDFVRDEKVNRNDLDNIIGAFKIAYYENEKGERGQIVTIIEKDRIMRAYNAAMTKNVWKSDTQKMVKKTVTWEMFNGEDIRPFMDYPQEIIEDLKIVNENEDIDFNKEHKYHDVVNADEHSSQTLGSGEEVGFDN